MVSDSVHGKKGRGIYKIRSTVAIFSSTQVYAIKCCFVLFVLELLGELNSSLGLKAARFVLEKNTS